MKETPAHLQLALSQLRQAGLLRWDVAVPEGLEQEALWLANVCAEREAALSPTLRRHYRQLEAFWQSLSEPRGVRAQAVCSQLGLSFRSLRRLHESGLVTLARDFPDLEQVLGKQQRAYAETLPERFADLQLNSEQQAAFDRVRQAAGGEGFLLWGVTGSGKTEVYLKLLEHTIAQGKTALVLFPEIALTQALYERFTRRLGSERVVVWHSQRSDTEKRQSWHRIASGEVSVVLGARSAVFVPLPRLGLILLDECHDDSFKQETPAPRYDARTLAHWLAQEHNAPLVLGSATPTVPQFYRAETHELTLLPLRQRYQARPLPEVSLLRARPRKGFACLSDPLIEALERTLEAGQQAIVLLNRRGYHTLVQCQVCGHVFECQTCSVAMTVHKAAPQQEHRHLYCHQCDAREPMPQFCPHCAAQELATLGMGTQRLEAELQQALPATARISRLDGDVLRSKRAYAEAMTRFSQGASDILVGTQIIAKGLDIPNVTLVGVIQADAGLKVPDFKAQERLFQLLTQVAGRSGRGEQPGKVLLQVIDPEHPVLGMAVAQDFERFYRYELDQRLTQGYPPFSQLLRLVFSATDEERARFFAQAFSQHLGQHLREAGFADDSWQLQGPALATVAKVKDYWRYQSLLKNKAGGDALRQAVLAFISKNPAPKGIRLLLDVDAESLL